MINVCFELILVERFDMGAWDEEWSDLERERERCFRVEEREGDVRMRSEKVSQRIL